MTKAEAGKILLDYVNWANNDTASTNDCPFDTEEVFEAMRIGGETLTKCVEN